MNLFTINFRVARASITRTAGVALVAFALTGCNALIPRNSPITQVDPDGGYRISNLLKREERPHNSADALVLLAFSGGGTRAAALSYGVLEELRRTPVTVKGDTHAMLDEVDMVSGVSGGSFTALAYALYGERLFTEYESRFLKRDVQGELIARAFSPRNWGHLLNLGYGRSELAADYYDEILFGGATFGDLLKRRQSPAALVTGTDLSTGARFDFTQDNFDLLCSDLSAVRLARAAATSSAVPVVLSPVTYANYGGHCNAVLKPRLQEVGRLDAAARPVGRELLRYRETIDLQDSERRPFIHVVDGGVSDNLGVRGMIDAFQDMEASPQFQKDIGYAALRHIVVIVVNSRSAPSTDWDRTAVPPGCVSQLLQASRVPIDHFSSDSVALLSDIARHWGNRRKLEVAQKRIDGMTQAQAEAAVQDITFDAIDVSFDAVADPRERSYFMNLPTSFVLSDDQVDKLRALGGRLLRDSPAFQKLLSAIASGNTPASPGTKGVK